MSTLPPPPPNLHALALREETVDPGTLLRLAGPEKSSHYRFRRSAWYRFDSPDKSFGVLYAAFDLQTAFVETVLRDSPQHRTGPGIPLAWKEIADRRVITFTQGAAARPLRLAALYGPGLAAAGIDNRISTADDYPTTRAWAKALHDHPQQVDGLIYMSRYVGNDQSVVLFNRARSAAKIAAVMPLTAHPDFAAVLENFAIAIERPTATRRPAKR